MVRQAGLFLNACPAAVSTGYDLRGSADDLGSCGTRKDGFGECSVGDDVMGQLVSQVEYLQLLLKQHSVLAAGLYTAVREVLLRLSLLTEHLRVESKDPILMAGSWIVPRTFDGRCTKEVSLRTQCRWMTSRFHQDFEQLELLGRGAFGEVWRCRHRADGREYAVKVVRYLFDEADGDGHMVHSAPREAITWASVDHPNVVRYHASWVEIGGVAAADVVAGAAGEVGHHKRIPIHTQKATTVAESSRKKTLCDAGSYWTMSTRTGGDDTDGGIVFEKTQGAAATSVQCDVAMEIRKHPASPPKSLATLYIQTELCSRETLQMWIARRNAAFASYGRLTEKERGRWAQRSREISWQCIRVVAHLHAKGYMHRDIKPANILFADDGDIRLGDFGLAKDVSGISDMGVRHLGSPSGESLVEPHMTQQLHTSRVGTPSYASPEQLTTRAYGIETDVFSLGVVLAELLCPVKTQHERALLLDGLRQESRLPAEVVAAFPEESRIVLAMTHPEPKARPSAGELLDVALIHEMQPCLHQGGDEVSNALHAKASYPLVSSKWPWRPHGRNPPASPRNLCRSSRYARKSTCPVVRCSLGPDHEGAVLKLVPGNPRQSRISSSLWAPRCGGVQSHSCSGSRIHRGARLAKSIAQ